MLGEERVGAVVGRDDVPGAALTRDLEALGAFVAGGADGVEGGVGDERAAQVERHAGDVRSAGTALVRDGDRGIAEGGRTDRTTRCHLHQDLGGRGGQIASGGEVGGQVGRGEGAVVDGDVTEGAEPGAGAVGGVGEGEGEGPVPVGGRARAGRGGLGHTVHVERLVARGVAGECHLGERGPGGAGRAEHRAGRWRAGGVEAGGKGVVGEAAPGALAEHEVGVDQRRAGAGDDAGGAGLFADVRPHPGDQGHLVGRLHGVGHLGCCTCGGDDGVGVDGESATGDPADVAGVVDGQVERCAGAAVGDGGAGAVGEVVVDHGGGSGGGGGDGPGDGGGVGFAVLVVGGELDGVGGAGGGAGVDGAGDLAGGGVDTGAGWKAGGGEEQVVVVVVGGVDVEGDGVAFGVGLIGDGVEDGGDVDGVDGPVDGGGVGAALLVVDGEIDGVDRAGGGGLGDGAGDLAGGGVDGEAVGEAGGRVDELVAGVGVGGVDVDQDGVALVVGLVGDGVEDRVGVADDRPVEGFVVGGAVLVVDGDGDGAGTGGVGQSGDLTGGGVDGPAGGESGGGEEQVVVVVVGGGDGE